MHQAALADGRLLDADHGRRKGAAKQVGDPPTALPVLVLCAAGLSVLLGIGVIVGWHIGNSRLIQVAPAFTPMQYNTALGFLLAGVALACAARGFTRMTVAAGVILGALGILTTAEYAFDIQLGIDELFMKHYIVLHVSHPGRMASSTSTCFTLLSLALLIAAGSHRFRLPIATAGLLGVVAAAAGMVSAAAYLQGNDAIANWGPLSRMAVHTSVEFIVLGLGVAALAWHRARVKREANGFWVASLVGASTAAAFVLIWEAMESATPHLFWANLTMVVGLLLSASLSVCVYFFATMRSHAMELAEALDTAQYVEQARHQAQASETKMLLSDERHRALVQAFTAIFWTTDATGMFSTPQPAWENYTGQTWEEYKGSGEFNVLHPDDQRRIAHLWQEALDTQSTFRAEYRLWHAPSRDYHYCEAFGIPLFNPDGTVREWVGAVRDIDEEVKQAERGLHESEERMRNAILQAPVPLASHAEEGKIIHLHQGDTARPSREQATTQSSRLLAGNHTDRDLPHEVM